MMNEIPSLAQLVESLTRDTDFAGSKPLDVTHFFFHAKDHWHLLWVNAYGFQ